MPLFSLRFHECDGSTSELDTVEASGIDGAREIAVQRARGIMADEIRQGRLCMSCWIVIADRQGNNLMTLQFGDAVTMPDQPTCGHHTEEQARGLA